MTLSELAELVEIAITHSPPKSVLKISNDYYQPYYFLMSLIAAEIQEGHIVELGVNKGYGVNSFAYGNPDVRVIGLDLNMYPERTLSNVEFHLLSALPVPDFIDNIAVLHIDTEHSYGNALNEFMQYKCKLLPGAVVMFDDLHAMDDGVLRAFYELPYDKIQCDKLHPVNGYGVLIYE